jgi:tetratricopeptide (TPR) repeat protein
MCGGDIELSDDKTTGTCDSCGCAVTFPKVCDERRAGLFNRGNNLRMRNEFDKAYTVFEKLIEQDPTDAEAHWCLVLCRYGIEYVEDPVTRERVPTCHRASYDSPLTDLDYLAAIEYADEHAATIYAAEAKKIAAIQKAIIAMSQQAEPYDIFICYKETAADGSRTKDSVIAQDIYYELTNAGYRVFFSRLTLEGRLGVEYEPYIFAALNSAKVMLVIGTTAEYFNAVWVKNEWSRYMSLMKNDRKRLLIPCYRYMNPYDIPPELAALQSQDMSRIGFIQDITRGIKKVLGGCDEVKASAGAGVATAAATAGMSVDRMVQNANTHIKINNYNDALRIFNRLTEEHPEDYRGWWGLIQCNTQLFTKPPDDMEELNKWMRYVKHFAGEKDYAPLEKEYAAYLKTTNDADVAKEIEKTGKAIADAMAEVASLTREREQAQKDMAHQERLLQKMDINHNAALDDAMTELDRVVKTKRTNGITVAVTFIIGVILFIVASTVGVGVLAFLVFVAMFVIVASHLNTHSKNDKRIAELNAIINTATSHNEITKRKAAEEQRKKEFAEMKCRIITLNQQIAQAEKQIAAGSKFLASCKSKIANRLLAQKCRSVGISQQVGGWEEEAPAPDDLDNYDNFEMKSAQRCPDCNTPVTVGVALCLNCGGPL